MGMKVLSVIGVIVALAGILASMLVPSTQTYACFCVGLVAMLISLLFLPEDN